ncbi:Transposon Tf2-1 polyprotein [Fusarium oxysporum f. sp. albedinis]|nr:Transposon Tf2-1 polyprotein [Fusarium oxysporum f. sp. albedinis]
MHKASTEAVRGVRLGANGSTFRSFHFDWSDAPAVTPLEGYAGQRDKSAGFFLPLPSRLRFTDAVQVFTPLLRRRMQGCMTNVAIQQRREPHDISPLTF